MWLVRDFTLRLERDGKKITSKEYLEEALLPASGFDEATSNRNQVRSVFHELAVGQCDAGPTALPSAARLLLAQIRQLVSSFFRDRDCVTLARPVEEEADLRRLESLSFGA